jgi:hypothetical protein
VASFCRVVTRVIRPAGYLLGLAYWRLSDLLDKIPGFQDGTAAAYDRAILRHPPEEEN